MPPTRNPPASAAAPGALCEARAGSPWQRAGWFGLAFWACAELSQYLSVPIFSYVTFWLPAGLYVAVLLLHPTRTWPWFMLSALAANMAFDLPLGTPFLTILGFYIANTLEALAGAWMVRRWVAERPGLQVLKEFLGLTGYAAGLATMVGATIGAATLVGSGISHSYLDSWTTWWGNEAMAILLVAPFILCWFGQPVPWGRFFNNRAKTLEAVVLVAGLVGGTWYMLVDDAGIMAPYKSRLMLFLLWAGLRFGLRGVMAANLLFALLTAFLTTHFLKGLTPEQQASGDYISVIQSFVAISVLITLIPAIVIVERDKNLAQLRDSEDRFRRLTEAAFEGIVISEHGRVLDVNDPLLKMFGCRRADVVGRECLEMVAPESRAVVAEAIRTENESLYEQRLLRPDGSAFYAESQAKMIRSGGRVLRMTALRDITERKRAEEEKERLSRNLKLLLESTGEGIYGIDLHGNCTFINQAGAEMFGYKPAELLDVNLHDKLHHHRADGSPYPGAECPVVEVCQTGTRCRIDHEVFWRKNGVPVPVEYLSYPIFEAGIITGAVVTFVDITQRRKLEEQLRQSQKMEAIGRLAGGVAHDFNNILTAMQLETHMACLVENVPAKVLAHLNDLNGYADRAASLTRQLVVFSRQQVMQTRPLNLNRIATNLTTMLKRIVGEDIEIRLRLAPRPAVVQADAGMLDQVFLNLVVNARDAMSAGGCVDIEIAEQQIEQTKTLLPELTPGRYILLTVTDTGSGIAPENLPHIFEPFYTTKELGKGTGLGLATVFGIVKQHGGSIQVESTLGQGTTFSIYLPAHKSGEGEEPAVSPPQSHGGTETILLVEDDPGVRTLMRGILKRNGYQVLAAANGVEALRIWEQHTGPIHLLLTDIVMPAGLNGRELAAQLLQRQPALRVIFTSGYSADIAGRELALQAGQNFIPKPSPPAKILKTLRECLDS